VPPVSTLTRKAWGDLTRHRARTLLAVFTLSMAIASAGFLAAPALLNDAMSRQVQESHLYDVALSTRVLDLSPAQLSALGHLPGVAAVTAHLVYVTDATTGGRDGSSQTVEIGGGDLASSPVDTIPLLSGRLPGPGEVLADAADARAADFVVPNSGTVTVRAASGAQVPLRVSGTGMNLAATPGANGSTTPVLYASRATVESLAGVRGVNALEFRLTDDSPAGASRAISAARAYLSAQTGADPITALPQIRAAGDWPGKTAFGNTMALLYIVTGLAFLSALFLISATMNTLIAEQAGEIAILKTLGGRRRQIGGIVLRTAAMLGAAGAVLGTILGVVVAYLLVRFFAATILDVSVGFGVSAPVVVASLLLGPALAVAASLPALRRALRRPVAETLAGGGTAGYGAGRLDRLVARSRLLSGTALPGSVRMGVRNALRQKRRSTAAIAQVAVAAGLAIAFLALGRSASTLIDETVAQFHFNIGVGLASGSPPFSDHALAVAASTPGVTGAQPVETGAVRYEGQVYSALGLGTRPLFTYRLSAGRWFTSADLTPDLGRAGQASVAPVVLGPVVAQAAHASVGQVLSLDTAAGQVRARVIGLDTTYTNNGQVVYFPLPVLERMNGTPGESNSLWLTTASSDHGAIKQTAAAVSRRLDAAGYRVSTVEVYAVEASAIASATTVLTIVQVVGLLVVGISLLGLVSALGMGVIERTREVGILRCVGARARDVRRVFSAEAVALAAVGWAFGVPLGWLIYQGLLALVLRNSNQTLPVEFTPLIPLGTLAGVLVLTFVVIRWPLRRATRIQPGLALRYQ
jgi:putative ABC transport system permease protein